MNIKKLLLPILFSFFLLQVQAVHTVERSQDISSINDKNFGIKHIKSNIKRSWKALNQVVSKKLKKAALLDNPKRILVLAAIALAAGIVLSLVANVILAGIIGTIAWLCFIAGFALFILWIYTILIRP